MPTATELKTRYPDFVDVADATVTAFIADATRFVDDTWFADDIDRAIMALAAHMMAMEGLGANAVSRAGAGVVTSYKLGDAAETYAPPGGGGSGSEYEATAYGRTFLRIMAANVPAVAIV